VINLLVFQLKHSTTFSRRVLIFSVLALPVMTLVIAVFVAGCSDNPEAQPAPPAKQPKAATPKPQSDVKPATKPAEPAAKKPETPPEPPAQVPEEVQPIDIGAPVREADSGRLHMRAELKSNLAAPVRVSVIFVLSKDPEGKDVIRRIPLMPMEVVLEPGKPTRVSILLEEVEPRGEYYCRVEVKLVK